MKSNIRTPQDEIFINRLTQIVLNNLGNEQFGVTELSDEIGISRSYLFRKIKLINDQSISQFISEIRLKEAYKLIVNEDLTASEVAFRAGFNDPSYFNKCFHKFFGFPPGEVKNHLSEKSVNVIIRKEESKRKKKWQKGNVLISAGLLLIILLIIVFSTFKFGDKADKEKSIAILPFDNLSHDVENRYFADGVVEDLLNRFSKIENLKVISRTSSEMFRDKGTKSIPQIAKILGVNYILEGTVQREKNNIRINVQLIDALTDNHIMSKKYDKKLNEFFKTQSEIAEQITAELSLYLTDEEIFILKQNQTDNLEAFNYYQIGLYHLLRRSKEELYLSVDYFNKAIEVDSNYALAYAGLADTYYILAWHRWIDPESGRDIAYNWALKALELDENLAEAHAALGGIFQELDFNMEAAEKEYLLALEKNPNCAEAYKTYAELLFITGRKEKAREYINKALSLDPLSFIYRHLSTLFYFMNKEYDKALEEDRLCLQLVKDHPWSIDLNFLIYLKLGNEQAAFENFRKSEQLSGKFSINEADRAYKESGIKGLLRLQIKRNDLGYTKANCYILLGEKEKALEALENGLLNNNLRPFDIAHLLSDDLESDPRYKAIKKKLGLGNY